MRNMNSALAPNRSLEPLDSLTIPNNTPQLQNRLFVGQQQPWFPYKTFRCDAIRWLMTEKWQDLFHTIFHLLIYAYLSSFDICFFPLLFPENLQAESINWPTCCGQGLNGTLCVLVGLFMVLHRKSQRLLELVGPQWSTTVWLKV